MQSPFSRLEHKLRTILQSEHDRLILWVPVCMGFGIAWYFHLKTEPPVWLGAVAFAIGIACTALLRRSMFWRSVCLAATLFAFGVALSQLRTHSIHSPTLSAPLGFAHVSGKIAEIQPTPKGSKLLLEDVQIEKLTPEQTPAQISVTLRSYDAHLTTGQTISLTAGLFPPPEPALPGSFDFQRYFYFQEIGAVGFGIGSITAIPMAASESNSFAARFAEFRHRLTEAIRSYFHEPAGAVAAAFITGEVRAIPSEINDNMRIAGLYHLLAVSGMNLSVVAGLAFFSIRFLLAAIPGVAVRYPIKKWAAILALIASYIYLRVAGAPVSAERAFFMVSLIFIAILLDRDPTPMRSVAIAAFCIALYEPEAVLTASFQLSFSATAALIASYEWGMDWLTHNREDGFGLRTVFFYFAAVMVTSLVAWLGTEPFIIYHFNQFSSYSLLANTIAEPLVSFILMPLVIAGVLLLPSGLSWLVFTPMQYGVDLLLSIATHIAKLPHAMWVVPNPTDGGFALAVLGGTWVYLWKTSWRWLGLILVALGMSTAFFYDSPDMFVSDDGKHVALRLDDGRFAMLKGRNNTLIAQQWARAAIETEMFDKKEVPMQCDSKGCIVHAKGRTIALLNDAGALRDDCHMADIIVMTVPSPPDACGDATILLDQNVLAKNGGAALWLKPEGIIVKQVKPEQGVRPWVGPNAQ